MQPGRAKRSYLAEVSLEIVGTQYERWARVLFAYGFAISSAESASWWNEQIAQLPGRGELRIRASRLTNGLPDVIVAVDEKWRSNDRRSVLEAASYHGQTAEHALRHDLDPFKPIRLRTHRHRHPPQDRRREPTQRLPTPEEFVAELEQLVAEQLRDH
jgi:hypothetical protein